MDNIYLDTYIIPYQELSGNYNESSIVSYMPLIIPYQELSGNYNDRETTLDKIFIIPYQELSGNYNFAQSVACLRSIIPYQELSGNTQFLCCAQIFALRVNALYVDAALRLVYAVEDHIVPAEV